MAVEAAAAEAAAVRLQAAQAGGDGVAVKEEGDVKMEEEGA